MGILEVLTVVFVVLKIVGVIAWSWWWVFAPLWLGYLLIFVMWFVLPLVFAMFLALVAAIFGVK